ncbi:MAG: hypothetical protein AAGA19_05035 [Pseudomonadota bacterium]
MERIVISSPRSGLNWLRFVVEDQCGLRTPGKTVLIDAADQPKAAFVRSHDPLGLSRRPGLFRRGPGAGFTRIDPEHTRDAIVVLLLRDYREVFVRSCKKRYSKYRYYTGNIEFFLRATSERKKVFYYEEAVKTPADMAKLLAFLELSGPEGPVTADMLSDRWDDMGTRSRIIYDKNQRAAGGAKTKADPLNFTFHQQNLSPKETSKLTDVTRSALPPEGLALLDRYLEV